MKPTRFRAEVLTAHNGAGVEVPFDPSLRWKAAPVRLRPGQRGHPVRGRINGFEFESAIVSREKRYILLVDEALMRKATVAVGDVVDVSVEPLDG